MIVRNQRRDGTLTSVVSNLCRDPEVTLFKAYALILKHETRGLVLSSQDA